MAIEQLSKLTEAQVRELAGGQSFERGKDYYSEGAILEPVHQGMELRAECAGTETYQVCATLGEDGVVETSCTCPYDWGGVCKHVVALLLAYVRHPAGFRVVPPLEAMLAERSKAELIALIGEMVNFDRTFRQITAAKGREAGLDDISPYPKFDFLDEMLKQLASGGAEAMQEFMAKFYVLNSRIKKKGLPDQFTLISREDRGKACYQLPVPPENIKFV